MRLRRSHVIRFLDGKSGIWERLTIDECVDEVEGLLDDPAFQETDESMQPLANLRLETRVRAALRQDLRTRNMLISIKADRGRVTLGGMIEPALEARDALEVASGVPGVKDVKSELRTIGPARTLHMED